MKLRPITNPYPGQRVQCVKCHAMKPVDECVADLDGPPFTFYCKTDRPDAVGQAERIARRAYERKWDHPKLLAAVERAIFLRERWEAEVVREGG